jgi:hypothetical protein
MIDIYSRIFSLNGTIGARNCVEGRYSIMQNGKPTDPASAVEFAVDLHATKVIAASNYQRCIIALWMGYYNVQYYEDDRLAFGEYKYLTSRNFSEHFDTQRIKGLTRKVGLSLTVSSEVSEFNEFVLYDVIFGFVYDYCKYSQFKGKFRFCGGMFVCFCIRFLLR